MSEYEVFVSEKAKLVFALTQLDGEARAQFLGIEKEMCSSLNKATDWHNQVTNVICRGGLNHLTEKQAVEKLNVIFDRMKVHGV